MLVSRADTFVSLCRCFSLPLSTFRSQQFQHLDEFWCTSIFALSVKLPFHWLSHYPWSRVESRSSSRYSISMSSVCTCPSGEQASAKPRVHHSHSRQRKVKCGLKCIMCVHLCVLQPQTKASSRWLIASKVLGWLMCSSWAAVEGCGTCSSNHTF